MINLPKSFYHFSIDDVFDSLIEVTDKNIPLVKHPFFKFLKELNDRYNCSIGINLFYQKKIDGKIRKLSEIPNLTEQLINKKGNKWLYFAPHALDFQTPPYTQEKDEQISAFELIYKEIDRFAGKDFYAKWIRLHYYSESFELSDYFKEKGVEALFTTEKEEASYKMTGKQKHELRDKGTTSYEGMDFIRTHFRAEYLKSAKFDKVELKEFIEDLYLKYGFVIFYTHEYEIPKKETRDFIVDCFDMLKKLKIRSISRV